MGRAVTGMPRWLVLQAEHDYAIWRLGQIRQELAASRRRTVIEMLVDEATGHQPGVPAATLDALTAEVRELTAVVDEYRREAGLPPIPMPEGPGSD